MSETQGAKPESQKNLPRRNGSSIGVVPPRIYMTCWNESNHKSRGPVRYNDIQFGACPECGTVHKVTHRIDGE